MHRAVYILHAAQHFDCVMSQSPMRNRGGGVDSDLCMSGRAGHEALNGGRAGRRDEPPQLRVLPVVTLVLVLER